MWCERVSAVMSGHQIKDILGDVIRNKSLLSRSAAELFEGEPTDTPVAKRLKLTLQLETTEAVAETPTAHVESPPAGIDAIAAAATRAPRHKPAKEGKRSVYRGITKRKRGWEAHVWRGGKQSYLGGYPDEESAARAYDLAVIKIRGMGAETNFPSISYVPELQRLTAYELSFEDFVKRLRDEAKAKSRKIREEIDLMEHRRVLMLYHQEASKQKMATPAAAPVTRSPPRGPARRRHWTRICQEDSKIPHFASGGPGPAADPAPQIAPLTAETVELERQAVIRQALQILEMASRL